MQVYNKSISFSVSLSHESISSALALVWFQEIILSSSYYYSTTAIDNLTPKHFSNNHTKANIGTY